MSNFLFRPWTVIGFSAAVLVATLAWLLWPQGPNSAKANSPLVLYCAAGIKAPVESAVKEYKKLTGRDVQVQFGGSQTLLANMEVSHRGDVYIPADDSYLKIGREKNLLAETIRLARMRLALAVRKGNPKQIRAIEDLLKPDVRLVQGDPEATAIGHVTREALRGSGQWDAVQKQTAVYKLTVNDVANDLKIGAVDAGFIWDAVLKDYPELEMVPLPNLTNAQAAISIAVLRSSLQPAAALHFARFLSSPEHGSKGFARHGFEAIPGDMWTERPELILYSGAVNRPAVEKSIQEFEAREGVRITPVYNGCGILVGQMKAGGRPDVYLTCDASFVPPVADLFIEPPVPMSQTEIIILVPKGNPRKIQSLADLAQPGLRIGVANPEQSTLGALTRRMLQSLGALDSVMRNVVTQTPTADLLVNEIRAGALDAVVVYTANTTKVRDRFDLVKLQAPGALAVQTYSVGANSRYKQLAARLMEALHSGASRARYREAGFELATSPGH